MSELSIYTFDRLKITVMKKLVLIFITLLFSVSMFAQEDVTKFLGIPVDGFKPEMVRSLKAKGFVQHPYNADILTGEFNGREVNVGVVTNNNKVYRIFLQDKYTVSETDIKIRFNTLCSQFKNNKKYISIGDQSIPEDEDISYEIGVKNKRYEATFFQTPEKIDTLGMQAQLLEALKVLYTEEELANPTEEMQTKMLELKMLYTYKLIDSKQVWFMIDQVGSNYRILMYYDNKRNQANGEDL